MDVLETHRQQFVRAVRERDANHDQMMQLTRERDAALQLAVARNQARIREAVRADIREQELLEQIEEL